ncbi:hypothetical protein K491DRAFT_681915 [Lophiostoma macrostomum CBS 122681]|uniref:Uncharacterized protein n=1 Tax=Lophiostoma macrostomum CBS 122681 TaxID=1314788 RepID=A0A6A6SXG0_9PLEO|nr:hypothetical protein K491DRAFT_681915 [Lophiostoma macrostomum CBS 122681]
MAQPTTRMQTRRTAASSKPASEMHSTYPTQCPSSSADSDDLTTSADDDEAVLPTTTGSRAKGKGKVKELAATTVPPYDRLKEWAFQEGISDEVELVISKLDLTFADVDPVLQDKATPGLSGDSRLHRLKLFLGEDEAKKYQLWALLVLHQNMAAQFTYVQIDAGFTSLSSYGHVTARSGKSGPQGIAAVASRVEYNVLKDLPLAYPFNLIPKHYPGEKDALLRQALGLFIKFAYIGTGKAGKHDYMLTEPKRVKANSTARRIMAKVIKLVHDDMEATNSLPSSLYTSETDQSASTEQRVSPPTSRPSQLLLVQDYSRFTFREKTHSGSAPNLSESDASVEGSIVSSDHLKLPQGHPGETVYNNRRGKTVSKPPNTRKRRLSQLSDPTSVKSESTLEDVIDMEQPGLDISKNVYKAEMSLISAEKDEKTVQKILSDAALMSEGIFQGVNTIKRNVHDAQTILEVKRARTDRRRGKQQEALQKLIDYCADENTTLEQVRTAWINSMPEEAFDKIFREEKTKEEKAAFCAQGKSKEDIVKYIKASGEVDPELDRVVWGPERVVWGETGNGFNPSLWKEEE